jgi:Ran GTPase-activating protein (RanGAP) involved in mRNA processing and transport
MSAFSAPTSISLPGPRELLSTSAQVSSLLSRLPFPPSASVTRLRIGDKSYTAAAAAALCEQLLSRCPGCEELDMADVIAGRMEAEGLEVLAAFANQAARTMPGLTAVDLSDNAMGLKGISACRPLFDCSRATLSSLSMCNDGLSHQSMGEVADLLCEEPPIQLERLHFFNNMSGDAGCEHFGRILGKQRTGGLLKDLRFSGTRASGKGSVHIAEALAGGAALFGASLGKLDLNDNTFSESGAKLAAAFGGGFGRNLARLNLGECSMGDETTRALLRGLLRHGTGGLTHLELGGNELTGQSMKALGRLCRRNGGLEDLGLSENDEIASGGVLLLLGEGLGELGGLRALRLSCAGLGDRAGAAVAKMGEAWGDAKVEIDGNMFTPDVAEALQAA